MKAYRQSLVSMERPMQVSTQRPRGQMSNKSNCDTFVTSPVRNHGKMSRTVGPVVCVISMLSICSISESGESRWLPVWLSLQAVVMLILCRWEVREDWGGWFDYCTGSRKLPRAATVRVTAHWTLNSVTKKNFDVVGSRRWTNTRFGLVFAALSGV